MKKLLVLLAVTMTMVTVQAELLPVVNGDFEDTSVLYPDGAAGWNTSHFGIGTRQVPDETNYSCMFYVDTASQVINQTVAYSLTPGDTYTMEFDLNNGPDTERNWTAVNAQLWAKHPTLGTTEIIGSLGVTQSDFSSQESWQWAHFSFDCVYDGAANWVPYIQIQVVGGKRVYVDNITVDAVPEPVTMGMAGVGGLVIFLKRKRA